MKIRPGIVIDGKTIYPSGWMWILGFALGGCQWAIDEIENNEDIRNQINVYLKGNPKS